jgi:hypothetical protein
MRLLSERNADLVCELLNCQVPERTGYRDMLAKAFYGRLQAVRVRDRVIAKQDEGKELRRVVGTMEEGLSTPASQSSDVRVPKNVESLKEFLDMAVTESTEHLIVIYSGGLSKGETTGLVEALVDSGIPTIFIGEGEQSPPQASQIAGRNFFHLSPAAVIASSDEVLCVQTPPSCQRVLILRSVDLNAFRLINHGHAMNWVTVYYADRCEEQERNDPEAESYMVKNAEYVVVGSESLKTNMRSIGAQEVRVVPEGKSAKDQAAEILKLVADPTTKSPVRLAIEGANHG